MKTLIRKILPRLRHPPPYEVTKINLCSGSRRLPGYCNIDLAPGADLVIDLEEQLLPFADDSIEVVVCMSAINYFTRQRGQEIICDVYRVLKRGGIARFATQDLELIAKKYLQRDRAFFFQKLPDGRERFEGVTMADKFNSWFYGYRTRHGKHCQYFYDYETLALLFRNAGFSRVKRKRYRKSQILGIEAIDNRPEQMFFLEAVK